MKFIGVLLLTLLLAPSVFAAEGTVKLLALVEGDGESHGTLADLHLETRSGSEHVYLDTFPLTKIATQISMRFAEQVVCDQLDRDCSRTDFFYTIRASPGVVGGPSAGAAAAVLTAALIDGRRLDPSVGISGTINSGGLIGPVGGLPEKIQGAADGGLKTVLIPKGTALFKEDNKTVDLIALGNKLGINVVEVATLDEAMKYFTGSGINGNDQPFVIEATYAQTMKAVAEDLCNKYERTDEEDVQNLTMASDAYFANGEYYSAASYCFRANILLRQNQLEGIDKATFETAVEDTTAAAFQIDRATNDQPLNTMTDIQTYMLVKERLAETGGSLATLAKVKNVDQTAIESLAYAEERLSSARTWARFFGTGGQAYAVDNETLAQSCLSKIGEAEERFDYVQTQFPTVLKATQKGIDQASQEARDGDYVLCLHDAAKAKAEADSVLSLEGVEEDRIQEIIQIKLDATRRSLARAQSKGTFPLIGYAYYEYARALRTEDPYSSLLFSEYASELSNLDIYFTKHKSPVFDVTSLRDVTLAFVVGAISGAWAVYARRTKRRK
jgi:uncharacterized protein